MCFSFTQESFQRGGAGSCFGPRWCWTVGFRGRCHWKEEASTSVPARENCSGDSWRHAHRVPRRNWKCKQTSVLFLTSKKCNGNLFVAFNKELLSFSCKLFSLFRFTRLAVMTKGLLVGTHQRRGLRWSRERWRWMRRWSRYRQGTATQPHSQRMDRCTSGALSGLVLSLLVRESGPVCCLSNYFYHPSITFYVIVFVLCYFTMSSKVSNHFSFSTILLSKP